MHKLASPLYRRLCAASALLLAMGGLVPSTPSHAQDDDGSKTAKLPLHELTPDFTLKALSGKNLKLSEQRGDVVVLVFWASWCNTCRQILPVLNTLYRNYEKSGLVVFGITIDEDKTRARQTSEQLGLSFPILLDSTRTVSQSYQIDNTPALFFIAKDGSLRRTVEGLKPGYETQYEQEIRQMLSE